MIIQRGQTGGTGATPEASCAIATFLFGSKNLILIFGYFCIIIFHVHFLKFSHFSLIENNPPKYHQDFC